MRVSKTAIEPERLRASLTDNAGGAYVAFEGWIRDENDGQEVLRLEYEVYEPLAVKEGEQVIREPGDVRERERTTKCLLS